MARIEFRYCAFCVTGLYAKRVAARMRRELASEVEMTPSRLGVFQVLVNGQMVVDGGMMGRFGVLPSGRTIIDSVRARLSPV